jgi:predicted nucleotidyltransferase
LSDLSIGCEAVRDAADALGLRFALVGGFAVSVRAEPRFTRDIDLVVAVDDDNTAESLVRLLLEAGHTLVANVEQQAVGRLATSRIQLVGGELVDVLFASSGIEREVAAAAEQIEVLPGLDIPVAQVGHLISLKLLARDDATRPQDASDLRALIGVASEDDLERAREAAQLIEDRGYSRGRDLAGSLDALITETG